MGQPDRDLVLDPPAAGPAPRRLPLPRRSDLCLGEVQGTVEPLRGAPLQVVVPRPLRPYIPAQAACRLAAPRPRRAPPRRLTPRRSSSLYIASPSSRTFELAGAPRSSQSSPGLTTTRFRTPVCVASHRTAGDSRCRPSRAAGRRPPFKVLSTTSSRCWSRTSGGRCRRSSDPPTNFGVVVLVCAILPLQNLSNLRQIGGASPFVQHYRLVR